MGVRPEALAIGGPDRPGIHVVVDAIEELGSDTYVYTNTMSGTDRISIVVRREAFSNHTRGEQLNLVPDLSALHLFDGATGQRLRD